MTKILLGLIVLASALSLLGCGAHFYKPELGPNQPAEITVSAYTQQRKAEPFTGSAKRIKV